MKRGSYYRILLVFVVMSVLFSIHVYAGKPVASVSDTTIANGVIVEGVDLSGMTPETETTTTTTSSGLPEGVPIAPDAGNENYDGIGNTDVYQGIGDTDIFNADDTMQDDIVQPGF